MSRALNKLNALKVKNLKYLEGESNKHVDGGSLYLLINKSGAKYWRMDYYRPITKKRNTLALGVYPEVSLDQARLERDKARTLLAQDIDPAEARNESLNKKKYEIENTFEKIAREWLAIRVHEQKDDRENKRMLERDVFPYIGNKPINAITTHMLENEVTDRFIERGSLVAANKVRVPIKMIFALAKRKRLVNENPAQDMNLPRPIKGNYAAIIDPNELIQLMKAIWNYENTPKANIATASAMKLTALIFLRPGEIRAMKWSSYNKEEKTLEIIPLKQRKDVQQKTLIIPLSSQAVEIIEALYNFTGDMEYMFSSRRGKEPYLSEGTVNVALKRLGFAGKQTAHGFRATARTILEEKLDMPASWIEKQLSHVIKDPNGTAYNRTKFLKQRHEMMQEWSNFLHELINS